MPPSRARLFAAFAVLPLADALLAYFVFAPLWHPPNRGGSADASAAPVFAVLAAILGLLVTLCGAYPAVSWLRRRGTFTFPWILLAGVALGNVPFAVYALAAIPFTLTHIIGGTISDHLVPLSDLAAGAAVAIAFGSAMGAASAVVFWVVGVSGTDPNAAGQSAPRGSPTA